jgi:hypothetical protein
MTCGYSFSRAYVQYNIMPNVNDRQTIMMMIGVPLTDRWMLRVIVVSSPLYYMFYYFYLFLLYV